MKNLLPPQRLDVALQGGGAHGAFTWGVLDRLLEAPDIRISAVSGASAGAINATVFATGMATGGPAGAQAALAAFWKALNDAGRDSGPLLPLLEAFPETAELAVTWWSLLFGDVPLPNSPRLGKPIQDVLRKLLEEHVDFAALRTRKAPRLFIAATNVRTGGARIFRNDDLSVDALLASACLPLVFPPVTIDGAEYWDGGYSANPPLLPLVLESPNDDLLLITINPTTREQTPSSSRDISYRISELGFSQGLAQDLRGLDMIQKAAAPLLLARGVLGRLKRLRMHEIHDEPTLAAMHPRSKMVPAWQMLTQLHAAGREAADQWLGEDAHYIGKASTIDISQRYGIAS